MFGKRMGGSSRFEHQEPAKSSKQPWKTTPSGRQQQQQYDDNKKDAPVVVSKKRAAAASERLLQWKAQILAKHSIQNADVEERRRQEENFYIAVRSKVMSHACVQQAADRNYAAAEAIQWKKLALKAQVEKDQARKDDQECKFHPQLFAPRTAKLASVSARYRETAVRGKPSLNQQEEQQEQEETKKKSKVRSKKSGDAGSTEVFDRLYALAKTATAPNEVEKEEPRHAVGLSLAEVGSFLDRQEQCQRAREEKLSRLAEETRCSFTPELSHGTRQLSRVKTAKSIEELLRDERRQRQRRLERLCLSRRGSPNRNNNIPVPDDSVQFNVPSAFQDLLVELQAQEEKMKTLA